MKCYYHRDVDSIAICKNCNKGLCGDCAIDVGNGVACKERCEDEVKSLNEILAKSKTAYKKTGKAYLMNAIIYSLLGLFFLISGVLFLVFTGDMVFVVFLIPAGLIFLMGGYFNYKTAKTIDKKA